MPLWAFRFACASGCAAVLLGAFGAHAMQDKLSPKDLAVWQTAVQYQFWHTLALLFASKTSSTASTLFVTGLLLFSGSLYGIVLTGQRRLGMVTPIGGLALAAGWLALARDFYRMFFITSSAMYSRKRSFPTQLDASLSGYVLHVDVADDTLIASGKAATNYINLIDFSNFKLISCLGGKEAHEGTICAVRPLG